MDQRQAATKEQIREHMLKAARAAGASTLTLDEVVIFDLGDGNWNAAFSRDGANVDENALAAIPRVQSQYRLSD